MRVFSLALLGLAAFGSAAPTRVEPQAVEARQYGLGPPTVTLIPGKPSLPIFWPAPSTPTTILKPGKREESALINNVPERRTEDIELKALHDAYYVLLKPYDKDNHPSFGVYLILLHLADILSSKGITVDTFILGEAKTTFGISTKRQVFTIGGCRTQDVIGLRATLTSLLIIYGPHPPYEIWNLEQAIIAALIACGEKVEAGPIAPEVPVPGGPIKPEVPVPGGPVVPENPVPGGPLVPEQPVPGGPIKPSD
ncbi:hypothetical protein BN1723_002857, partial [Verticillium longisporum]